MESYITIEKVFTLAFTKTHNQVFTQSLENYYCKEMISSDSDTATVLTKIKFMHPEIDKMNAKADELFIVREPKQKEENIENLIESNEVQYKEFNFSSAVMKTELILSDKTLECELEFIDKDSVDVIAQDGVIKPEDTQEKVQVRITYCYGSAELILNMRGMIKEIEPLENGSVLFNVHIEGKPAAMDKFFEQINSTQSDINEFMDLAKGVDYH